MKSTSWNEVLNTRDNRGLLLEDHLDQSKVLLVFLRHFGCTYCKKAVAELKEQSFKGRLNGVKIVFVHMSSVERGEEFFKAYGFSDVNHISDLDKKLYNLFDLKRGSLNQLFGPKVLVSGVADVLKYGIGKLEGDGFQMQGVFLLNSAGVEKSYKLKKVSDKVNYCGFVSEADS